MSGHVPGRRLQVGGNRRERGRRVQGQRPPLTLPVDGTSTAPITVTAGPPQHVLNDVLPTNPNIRSLPRARLSHRWTNQDLQIQNPIRDSYGQVIGVQLTDDFIRVPLPRVNSPYYQRSALRLILQAGGHPRPPILDNPPGFSYGHTYLVAEIHRQIWADPSYSYENLAFSFMLPVMCLANEPYEDTLRRMEVAWENTHGLLPSQFQTDQRATASANRAGRNASSMQMWIFPSSNLSDQYVPVLRLPPSRSEEQNQLEYRMRLAWLAVHGFLPTYIHSEASQLRADRRSASAIASASRT